MSLTESDLRDWVVKLTDDADGFPSLEECLDKIAGLDEITSLDEGTRVLVRGDVDVKVKEGAIKDDVRLRSLTETLSACLKQKLVPILYGHMGRDPKLSLESVAAHMKSLLADEGFSDLDVHFVPDWLGDDGTVTDAAAEQVASAAPGSLVVLENTRKYPQLEQALWKENLAAIDESLPKVTNYANSVAEKLAKHHVNEGFAASNRDLSSCVVPLAVEKSYLGAYIARELKEHTTLARKSELVIFSGMKIQKLDDLQQILDRGQVKVVIAAGALALALLKADANLKGETFSLGPADDPSNKMHVPPARIEQAEAMIKNGQEHGVTFVLPVDFVLEDGTVSDTIPDEQSQMDIGPKTQGVQEQAISEFIAYHNQKKSETGEPAYAFHNGVFGKFEEERFSHGTRNFMSLLKRLTESGVQVYVGGGEGGAALMQYGDESWVTHCFTAGGTLLKALGTQPIPYIKALTLAAGK